MLDYLETLRKKPAKQRKRTALVTAFVITAAFIGLWIPALKVQLVQSSTQPATAAAPISSLSDNLSTGIDSIKNLYSQAQGDVQSITNNLGASSYSTSDQQSDPQLNQQGVQNQAIDPTTGQPFSNIGAGNSSSYQSNDAQSNMYVPDTTGQNSTLNSTPDSSYGQDAQSSMGTSSYDPTSSGDSTGYGNSGQAYPSSSGSVPSYSYPTPTQ